MKTRLFNKHDGPTFYRWFHDERLRKYFRDYQKLGVSVEDCGHMNEIMHCVMLVGENDNQSALYEHQLIGCFSFHPYGGSTRNYRVGYMIDPDFQGRHYGLELGTAAIKFAKDALNAHRLDCLIVEEDEKTWKDVEKFGFKREAVLEDSTYVGGRYQNEVLLSYIIKE